LETTSVEAVAGAKDGEVVKFKMKNWGLTGIVGFDNTEDSGPFEVPAVTLETILTGWMFPVSLTIFIFEKFSFHTLGFS